MKKNEINKENKEGRNIDFVDKMEPIMHQIIDNAGGEKMLTFNDESLANNIGLSLNQMLFTHRVTGEMPITRNAEKVLGYTDEEFTQELLTSHGFIHPEDSKKYYEFNTIAAETEVNAPMEPLSREYGFTTRIKKKNGEYHYIRATKSIITVNENKQPMSLLVIYSDLGKETLFLPSGMTVNYRKPYVRDSKTNLFYRVDAPFSIREREIMSLLVRGDSSKMIGGRLCLAKNTVDGYRKKLLKKTSSGNIAELVSKAILNAWV